MSRRIALIGMGREKLCRIIGWPYLEKVPGADAFFKAHGSFGIVMGAHALLVADGGRPRSAVCAKIPARADAANELTAIVGSFVAHHLVAGAPMKIRIREVTIKGALQHATASRCSLRRRSLPRRQIIQLGPIRRYHRPDVVRRLHASLYLE